MLRRSDERGRTRPIPCPDEPTQTGLTTCLIRPRIRIDAGGIPFLAGHIHFQQRPRSATEAADFGQRHLAAGDRARAAVRGRGAGASIRPSVAKALREALSVRPQTAADAHKQAQTYEREQDAREQAVRRAPLAELAEQSSIVGTRWLGGVPAVGSRAKDSSGRAVCAAA